MTAPVPEETNAAEDLDSPPPGEHPSDLPDGDDAAEVTPEERANAEESETGQPSQ